MVQEIYASKFTIILLFSKKLLKYFGNMLHEIVRKIKGLDFLN